MHLEGLHRLNRTILQRMQNKSGQENYVSLLKKMSKLVQFEFENVVPLIYNGSDLGYFYDFCYITKDDEQRLFNSILYCSLV